ncbi:hypothetical protein ACFIQG_22000, partial [Comamonas odontotermitis]|uniref:hypothetical protein n=1 Tax=Comamonas odontotermitis TaxID=379895 RepID=UPI0036734C61
LAMTGMVNGTTYNCTTIAHLSDGTSTQPSSMASVTPKAAIASAAPVPAISQCGLLLMMVLTAVIGLMFARRNYLQ